MTRFEPERLRARRSELNIRPERVAVAIERSAETISLWERGRALPNPHQLAQLADLLDCRVYDFFEVLS